MRSMRKNNHSKNGFDVQVHAHLRNNPNYEESIYRYSNGRPTHTARRARAGLEGSRTQTPRTDATGEAGGQQK